jgi:hypothetical protein
MKTGKPIKKSRKLAIAALVFGALLLGQNWMFAYILHITPENAWYVGTLKESQFLVGGFFCVGAVFCAFSVPWALAEEEIQQKYGK